MVQSAWATVLVEEISFAKRSSSLSRKAKTELSALFKRAATKGKMARVIVVSWGDLEYPSIHSKKEADEQEELVVNRNLQILRYIEMNSRSSSIQLFNMASHSESYNQFFLNENIKTKKALETAGLPDTDSTVKVPGKASKSIVIFIMDE